MGSKASKRVIGELAVAYNTELSGYAFYNYAADAITDERGKNIFRHIAKEEIEHMAVVATIADSLKKGLGMMGYEAALKKGNMEMEKRGLPIFPEKNDLIEKLKTNPTDQNAISIAIGAEEGAVEFYSAMLKHAETPEEKLVLTRLLEMEKGHLRLFRWEYESLTKTGFWCDIMEYSVEKDIE